VQWTRDAGPGVPPAVGDAVPDGAVVAVATADGDEGVGEWVAPVVGEPHAASPSINTKVTPLARTG
jgi:hypothetical protein